MPGYVDYTPSRIQWCQLAIARRARGTVNSIKCCFRFLIQSQNNQIKQQGLKSNLASAAAQRFCAPRLDPWMRSLPRGLSHSRTMTLLLAVVASPQPQLIRRVTGSNELGTLPHNHGELYLSPALVPAKSDAVVGALQAEGVDNDGGASIGRNP